MRARYIGGQLDTTTFGRTFNQWKWLGIDALDRHARETLAQNPQFETDDKDDEDAPEAADEAAPAGPSEV